MNISLLPKPIRNKHKTGFTISGWFIEALKSIHDVPKDRYRLGIPSLPFLTLYIFSSSVPWDKTQDMFIILCMSHVLPV